MDGFAEAFKYEIIYRLFLGFICGAALVLFGIWIFSTDAETTTLETLAAYCAGDGDIEESRAASCTRTFTINFIDGEAKNFAVID